MTRTTRLLIAESEPVSAREERRRSTGRSSGETYRETLLALSPELDIDVVRPAEAASTCEALEAYDGVVLSGSPIHAYESTPHVNANVAFVRAVFASGTPSFGSCAGLQLAVVAAGGVVRPNPNGCEIGIARRISQTEDGRGHPLLDGRPPSYDALSIHSDEVALLPERDALGLATSTASHVQAAEIRHDGGTFWGVQYHPELPLDEVADALRREADSIVKRGLARDKAEVDAQAQLFQALDMEPDRLDLAWRLGIDVEVTEAARRQAELRNFLRHLVGPTRSRRGRG